MSAREELAAAIRDVVVDHPMWIGDDGEPLEYLPEREGRIADFVNEATDALLASPALANLIREKQAEAVQGVVDELHESGAWSEHRMADWVQIRSDRYRADQVEGGA